MVTYIQCYSEQLLTCKEWNTFDQRCEARNAAAMLLSDAFQIFLTFPVGETILV